VNIYTKISGFGHFLPKKILSNEDLKKLVDTSDEWIYSRTGIKQRHIAEDSELTSNLAINAALSAFKDSKIQPKDIDCIMPRSVLGVSGPKPTAVKTKGNMFITGDLYVTGSVDCQSTGRLESRHKAADASPKKFDIVHPSQEGMRLAHACIEGAEVAIYHRGRVRNEKEIILPDYWKDLVHMNSISVQLQPIGAHQDIIIKRWDDEKIYLQSNGGLPIDCFYHVYAERKDCNPLVVEYQGDGWEDYPDKDYKDPNFSGPPNIITV